MICFIYKPSILFCYPGLDSLYSYFLLSVSNECPTLSYQSYDFFLIDKPRNDF